MGCAGADKMKVVLAGVLIARALLLGGLASASARPAAGSRGVPSIGFIADRRQELDLPAAQVENRERSFLGPIERVGASLPTDERSNLSPLRSEEPQSAGRVPGREELSLWWNLYWLYAVPPPIVEGPPTYIARPSRPYSYYCLSAHAYYPDVSRCPEPWVPVAAHR
jgi:hypothetical protein